MYGLQALPQHCPTDAEVVKAEPAMAIMAALFSLGKAPYDCFRADNRLCRGIAWYGDAVGLLFTSFLYVWL